jgi:hypothetical protein
MAKTLKHAVVGRFLDTSTCHITGGDSVLLDAASIYLPMRKGAFVVYKYPEGWWVYVPEDAESFKESIEGAKEEEYSKDFLNLMRTARAKKCWYLRLDADGTIYPELPTHTW